MYKLLGLLLLSGSLSAQIAKPEVAFILAEKDFIPEGIVYDPSDKVFYLGSIHKQKIVKIAADGSVKDFVPPNDKLEQVLGMVVDSKGMLWACNNSPERDSTRKIANVNVYRIKDGSLFRQFQVTDNLRHLFNDLCIAKNGDIYISDTNAGMIWRVRNGETNIEAFTKPGSVPWANGLVALPDGKRILVCSGSGMGIVSIDLDTRKVEAFPTERYLILGMDGMYLYKNQLIGVQNTTFPEAILRMTMDSAMNRVEKVAMLAVDQPQFEIPTTGAVVENHFYFIANSQLWQIAGAGKLKNPEQLKEVVIMKIKLD
jgi:streptogramin lyase